MTYPTYDKTIDTGYKVSGDWAAGYHPGVDFAVGVGTRVNASTPGTVKFAGRYGGWGGAFGIHVIIETVVAGKRLQYINAHLSKTLVNKGDHVVTDQIIGLSGKTGRVTGPHDHLEVRDRQFKYGQDVNPKVVLNYRPGTIDRMDPANYGPGHVGPHITEYGQQLVKLGHGDHYRQGPGPVWGEADRLNTRDFQLAQHWTGDDANGLPGPETLRRVFK